VRYLKLAGAVWVALWAVTLFVLATGTILVYFACPTAVGACHAPRMILLAVGELIGTAVAAAAARWLFLMRLSQPSIESSS
jgi:hypothetical protein